MDAALLHLLNAGSASAALDAVVPALTNLHARLWFSLPVLALVAWGLWRGGRLALVWFVAAGLAVGISDVGATKGIKQIIHRPRPCARSASGETAEPGVRVVAAGPLRPGQDPCPGSPSFPSNHSANMMALAGVCWWFTRRAGVKRAVAGLWFALPVLIGWTRLYLGYHYPTDVAAGWIWGAIVAAIVVSLARRLPLPTRRIDGPAHTAP